MMSSEVVYKRCRPALGTFAEVLVHGIGAEACRRAGEAAFAAIDAVARAMSFHDGASDLSRLNRAAPGVWVALPAALHEVLDAALRLQVESEGVFHVGIANALIARGRLPDPETAPYAAEGAEPDDTRPCFELRDGHARRLCHRRMDLGGIAKGYAVDAAIAAVRAVTGDDGGARVNIGGDLRVSGAGALEPVMVRLRQGTCLTLQPCRLLRAAMATSARHGPCDASSYVDTRARRPGSHACTVIAHGPSCMVADAFTKIGMLLEPSRALALAARYDVQLAVLS